MSRYWRIIALATSIAGLFFVVGFFRQYHLPRIERWILMEVERQSTLHSPLRIWPGAVRLSFFPPGLVLQDIRVLPKDSLADMLAPTNIKYGEVRLNWLHLLTGRIRLSYIGIRDSEIKVVLKQAPQRGASRDPWSLVRTALKQAGEIPVDELDLNNISLWLKLKSEGISLHTSEIKLNIENLAHSLLVDLDAPLAEVKWEEALDPVPINLSLKALLESDKIQLSSLKAKAGNSFLVAAGAFGKEVSMQARLQLELPEIEKFEKRIRKPVIPPLQGVVKIDVSSSGTFRDLQMRGHLEASELALAGREVGKISGDIDYDHDTIHARDISITHSAGFAKINRFQWRPQAKASATITATVGALELKRLLNALKIPNVPIHLDIKGNLNCSGPLFEPFELGCDGDMQASDLLVYTPDPKQKTIIAVETAKAKGRVNVTTSAVSYNAELQVGAESKGRSSGTVEYRKGFLISYEGDRVEMSDIKNLADLHLEGSAKVKGTTEGNAHSAVLTLTAQAKDIWLENFWLGNPESEISYKAGTLSFRKMIGQVGSSRYNGQLSIDLHKKHLNLQARSPYTELSDLKAVFSRKATIPLEIFATGAGEVTASGPLKFSELSYKVDAGFYRGTVERDNFDQLSFKINSVNGNVTSDQVFLRRGQSVVDLKGKVAPTGIIDAVMVGRKLRLEESETVSKLGLDLTGQLDFTTTIRGQLPHPTFDSHGRLSRMVIGDKPAEDSTFKLRFASDRIEGGGSFIGDVVLADFTYPLAPGIPFKFSAKATKWNFANLFSVLSTSVRQRDFVTNLSGKIDLTGDRPEWSKLSGNVQVDEFSLQRGAISVKNSGLIALNIQSGVLSGKPFALEGEGGYLRVAVPELGPSRLNATVNGKLDLSLVTLLTPFLADLQGKLALNISFSGSGTDPQATGSAYVEQGVVRFREFPHPFTNLRTDIIFSEKGATINAVRAELAGGTVTGLGKIKWQSRTSVPVDVKGQFSGVNLNVPEGFRTRGSGSWSFVGNFFPYTLGVNYDITGGDITAEFGTGLGESKTISPSRLLPKALVEKASQPLRLDFLLQIRDALPIKNELLDCQVRGKLQVNGPPNDVHLTGTLSPVPSGKVFFRDTPFEIQTGFVEFQDDPPDNPKIYLVAQTRVKETVRDDLYAKGEKENQYEINLMVQGRGKQQKFVLSSMPPLSEKEIVSLLALGLTPSALEANRSAGQMAASNSVQIGTAILQKPLSKEARSRLGVDVQLSQTSTEDASYPKFTINKQFTPKLGASASRSFEKNPTNSVKMEYKFNRDFSVVGSWEGREGTEKDKVVEPSIFGLDLEYKVKFK